MSARDPLGTVVEQVREGLTGVLPGVDVREDIDVRWWSESQAQRPRQSPKPRNLPMVIVSGTANNDPTDKYSGLMAVNLEIVLVSNLLADENVIEHHAKRLIIWTYISELLADDTNARDLSNLGIEVDVGDLVETRYSVTIYV